MKVIRIDCQDIIIELLALTRILDKLSAWINNRRTRRLKKQGYFKGVRRPKTSKGEISGVLFSRLDVFPYLKCIHSLPGDGFGKSSE